MKTINQILVEILKLKEENEITYHPQNTTVNNLVFPATLFSVYWFGFFLPFFPFEQL